MRSVSYSFDVDTLLCCRNTQPSVFESSAFEHSGFVPFPFLFPLSSTSKGCFSLQVLKVEMTSERLCVRCSYTSEFWLALLRSGMLCISSMNTPCPVLILFFQREECDGRREVSKQKKIHCLYRFSAQPSSEGGCLVCSSHSRN